MKFHEEEEKRSKALKAKEDEEERRRKAWEEYSAKQAEEEEKKRKAAWEAYYKKLEEDKAKKEIEDLHKLALAEHEREEARLKQLKAHQEEEERKKAWDQYYADQARLKQQQQQQQQQQRLQQQAHAQATPQPGPLQGQQQTGYLVGVQGGGLAVQTNTTMVTKITTTAIPMGTPLKFPIRTVRIHCVEATDLPKKDEGANWADPYVKIKYFLGDKRLALANYKSAYIRNERHPTWNHAFVVHNFNAADTIWIQVWDKDWLSKDEFMGQTILTKDEVFQASRGDQWFLLQARIGNPIDRASGKIRIRIDLDPF
jgi:hypothetical protein